jgi:hypothetical protein
MRARAYAMAAVVCLSAAALAAPLASALPTLPVVPQVRVEIDDVAAVDVNRDTDTVIRVNGTVNVTVPPIVTVTTNVYLNVTVNNTYWLALIEPPSASFTGSGEFAYVVNVTVPGRVAVDAGAEVFVDANVSVAPGVGRSWTASTPIPIVQYYGVAVTPSTSSSPANFSAEGGAQTPFSLRVQNIGNGRDTFELRVDNLGELQAAGISVYLPSPVTVPAKVTANVNGNVSVPASLNSGNFTLAISAFSTGAAAKGETVTAAGAKTMRVVPPADGGGGGGPGGGGNNTTKPGGFLPGPGAGVAAVSVGVAAACWRRLRRP